MGLWGRRDEDKNLDRELQGHLSAEEDELRTQGLTPEQATHRARRSLGNLTLIKEDVRNSWGWTKWEQLIADFAFSLRILRKGYFESIRTPLLSGSAFSMRDSVDTPSVIMVNRQFAHRFLSGTIRSRRSIHLKRPFIASTRIRP